ncbi:oleoyl-acyl carrier protein thioesterase 1 [Carex littledalei]|uniref:Oleoyl-acyl carrier protein thioesterase 1 n=1 Tax=Carex littledalei TaxID=544730 RepID=A0A833QS30_9POAL|nr:oleoyl-acyl carrier protein thioesterase 1 [Carex littledalei]
MFSIHVAAPPFASISVQYRHPHNLSRAQRGVKCTTDHYGGRSATYAAPSLEKEHAMAAGSGTVTRETPGEKMRFGGLEGDELVYKERFVVRGSQVGVNKTANIEAIARNELQPCSKIGMVDRWISNSTNYAKAPPHLGHFPDEVVEIEHWSELDGRIAARFDFIIRNLSTSEVIGRSTSKWLMMNQDTRKLQKISGEPRRADLDMNKHVNNVTYYSWVLQSIPQDIVDTHELEAITIDYRRECQYSNTIDSLASTEVEIESVNALSNLNPNSEDRHQFLHLLKFSGMDQEINRGRTVWRKMDI